MDKAKLQHQHTFTSIFRKLSHEHILMSRKEKLALKKSHFILLLLTFAIYIIIGKILQKKWQANITVLQYILGMTSNICICFCDLSSSDRQTGGLYI